MNNNVYASNDLRKKIQDYSYGLKDVIGRGFSSVVYRGTNDKTKQKVAIKVVDIKSIQGKPQKKMLEGEIDALKKLSHPNILKCLDIFSTANNCYIITQFCNEGDLQNLLKKREKLSEEEALPLIREILTGFIYIAQSGYLHRDLKPANILLKDKVIKIADFGFAKKASSNPKQTVNVGSPLYMSPEALKDNIYTIKNDIWSIGVILYQILHGKAPWTCNSEKQLIEEISKNNIYLLKNLTEDLKDFIRKCLTSDDKKRFNLKQLTTHPLIQRILSDVSPILRKVTSNNQNQQVQNTQNNNVAANKPKILHHRQNNGAFSSPEKQFQAQLNWMRYLNRYIEMFPEVQSSGRYTLGIRFIALKQLLTQLRLLQSCFEGENPFMIQSWSQFASSEEAKKYAKALEEYRKRFQPFFKQLNQWIPVIGNDKKLYSIANNNLLRSEFTSMLALSFSIQQCKTIWDSLSKERQSLPQGELPQKQQAEALRLDFTMTFFQLNNYLVDNFNDCEYFARMSKLQTIIQYKPACFMLENVKDLEHKLRALEIIK